MSKSGQVVVVGAGASGIAAALAASQAAAEVVLIDEQEGPGGWLRSSIEMIHEPPDFLPVMRGFEAAAYGEEQLRQSSVDYRPKSIAWGLFENRTLSAG